MHVQIIDKATQKLIATYPIILGGLNYVPTEKEYHDAAWRCAVDDGAVTSADKSKYEFRMQDE